MAAAVCTEADLEAQRGLLTANKRFYVRNNFPYPEGWSGLLLGGAVARPRRLALAELGRLPARELVVTMECAGNGRAFLDPPVEGEQWALGAVSTARWAGVSLADVLGTAGLREGVREIGFEGADGFARSLPLEVALHPDTLLATRMNGAPLPMEHGGPLRLVVPRWYGMAAVKWLQSVNALRKRFRGHFQVERYVIDGRPVREMRVRAVITEAGAGRVAGYAWTGTGRITGVELSDDAGSTWCSAELKESAEPYGWTRWEARGAWHGQVLVRASDSVGNVQPLAQVWNELGYCNNAAVPQRLSAG